MTFKIPKFLPSFDSRRVRRPLSEKKKSITSELLPKYKIISEDIKNLNLPITFEIGFGSGEHIAHRAANNPNKIYVGSEVYTAGIAELLDNTEERKLKNLKIFTEDARLFIESMPDNSIAELYIMFPDPWPKNKHHKRRIITAEFLALVNNKLTDDGYIYFATDHPDYAAWALAHFNESEHFEVEFNKPLDFYKEFDGHIKTRYQEKNKAENPEVFIKVKRSESV